MTVRTDWLAQAIDDLANAPDWRLAAGATDAVKRYAEKGVGFVLHVPHADGPDEYRLLIPRTRTYVRIRRSPTTLYVERVIYRP